MLHRSPNVCVLFKVGKDLMCWLPTTHKYHSNSLKKGQFQIGPVSSFQVQRYRKIRKGALLSTVLWKRSKTWQTYNELFDGANWEIMSRSIDQKSTVMETREIVNLVGIDIILKYTGREKMTLWWAIWFSLFFSSVSLIFYTFQIFRVFFRDFSKP